MRLFVAFVLLVSLPALPATSHWSEDWRADFHFEGSSCFLWRSYIHFERPSPPAPPNLIDLGILRSTTYNVNFRRIVDADRFIGSVSKTGDPVHLKELGIVEGELHFLIWHLVYNDVPQSVSDSYPVAMSVGGVDLKKIEIKTDDLAKTRTYFFVGGEEAEKVFRRFESGSRFVITSVLKGGDIIGIYYEEPPSVSFTVRDAQFGACVDAMKERFK